MKAKGSILQSSYDLLYALKQLDYLKTSRDPLWWPNSRTLEVVVGVLLTQQTKWERVEESLENLRSHNLLTLQALSSASTQEIAQLIKPSGFYNTKSHRLKQLCTNILNEFGSFESFKKYVDREWLLAQKGIGMESADSILCYGCAREVFVVDSYTNRLLGAFGYEFENYMQIQEWMQEGIEVNFDKITKMYDNPVTLHTVYARFHGKIVEYAKEHIKGKHADIKPLMQCMEGKI